MRISIGAAAAAAALILLSSPTPTGATSSSRVIASVDARNLALHSYTFHMNVAMAMKHFPWLHFHLEGEGTYRRGDRYIVHFTSMPGFASKIHDIDLSMIDPAMWPGHYRYSEAGRQDDDTIFALEPIDDVNLKTASVALNEASGVRWVDATYADGTHIHMIVNSGEFGGFLLPASMSAAVDYPHMPIAAHADFGDYSFSN